MLNISKGYLQKGFTIIELTVIIVVIGILASIVLVGGSGYLQRSSETNAKTSLIAARHSLEQEFEKNGEYPEDIPSNVSIPSGFIYDSNGADFCISGDITGSSWFISRTINTPTQGSCPTLVDPSLLTIAFNSSSIIMSPDSEEMPGVMTVAPTVTGGSPPYTYSLAAGDSSSPGLTVEPGNELDPGMPEWTYVAYNTEFMGIYLYPPNPPVENLPPEFADKLIISEPNGDFEAVCNSWSSSLQASFKLIVTDSNNNQSEAPFTVKCA